MDERQQRGEVAHQLNVSVLIAARDEEELLPGALASVRHWAGEVVVVLDPRSCDRTREVAAAGGAVVLEHPFVDSSTQLAWGVEQCRYDWVFILDADERADARVGVACARVLANPRCAAYRLRRRNLAFGRVLRFGDWGGDRVVRLLHRRQGKLAGGMHWRVEAARIGRLAGWIEHHTLRSLPQYLPKLEHYATLGAQQLLAAGRRGGLGVGVLRGGWRFCRAYLVRLGFLDGQAGLLVALLGAWGTFLKWALLYELQGRRGGAGQAPEAPVPPGGAWR
jgi:glycosyltransferase involved in cell wall biosynthesis